MSTPVYNKCIIGISGCTGGGWYARWTENGVDKHRLFNSSPNNARMMAKARSFLLSITSNGSLKVWREVSVYIMHNSLPFPLYGDIPNIWYYYVKKDVRYDMRGEHMIWL